LQFCQPFIMYLLIRFRYGVSDYAAAALANGLLKDFGLITNSDRVEVIDEEGEAVRIFKTKATVDHLTFTAESGEEI